MWGSEKLERQRQLRYLGVRSKKSLLRHLLCQGYVDQEGYLYKEIFAEQGKAGSRSYTES